MENLFGLTDFQTILFGFTFLFGLAIFRFYYLISKIRSGSEKFSKYKKDPPIKTLICIGSGGHTTEMIKLISSLNPQHYQKRYYIMAKTDIVSEKKIIGLEQNVYKSKNTDFQIDKIPRSRIVGQSYLTSIITTLHSIFHCIPVVIRIRPDLIVCNGPGTCIPICMIAFMLKFCYICKTKIVFVESICRVSSFSLSGHILMYLADNIIVHWQELTEVCKRADYLGQLF